MRGTGTAVRTLTVVRAALGVCGVALGAVGVWQLVALTGPETPRRVAVWLAGAAVVHDALLAPLVLAVGWLVRRLPAAGVVRGGLVVAGCAVLVALPALLRPGEPANPSVLPLDYPRGLLLVLGVTAAVTCLLWLRAVAVGRRRAAQAGRRSARNGRS
ncbi:hypothetical protein [Streptomyces sp. 7-21]|uniref:hypothetical protein n=1 Tax=Streptomyces sp. 7-21 TaxID=2802283 RepID=UPI001F3A9F44|nr:hypothetical protein [Streptomyces sp. 7-21]